MTGVLQSGNRYLDLFDDDLYHWQSRGNADRFADHLDNLRLQMLAGLLFEGRIVVPEQWLVSSPTFCRLAAEMIEPWLELRLAGRMPRALRSPPIVPIFFSVEGAYDADARLLRALWNRLDSVNGSPVRLTRQLDLDDQHGVDVTRRARLRERLASELARPARADRNTIHFEDDLIEILDDEIMGRAFFRFCRYLSSVPERYEVFDKQAYHAALNFRVKATVASLIEDPVLRELNSVRHAAWLEFFTRAERNKISLASITALRKLLSENDGGLFDSETRRSIQNIGRFCMHSSLAEQCGSELTSMSYFLYEEGKPDQFDHALIAGIRRRDVVERGGALPMTGSNGAAISLDSLELLYRRGNRGRMQFAMDWPSIWHAFWEFMADRRYAADRSLLIDRVRAGDRSREWSEPRWRAYQDEAWDKLFEELCVKLRFVHFVRNPKDARYANIVLRAPEGSRTVLDVIANAAEKLLPWAIGGAIAMPALAVPLLALASSGLFLVGTGAGAALASDEARAALQIRTERIFGYTPIGTLGPTSCKL